MKKPLEVMLEVTLLLLYEIHLFTWLVLVQLPQKFEETLKLMLNKKSTKECMNILLLTNDNVFFLNGRGATSLMNWECISMSTKIV